MIFLHFTRAQMKTEAGCCSMKQAHISFYIYTHIYTHTHTDIHRYAYTQ